LDIESLIIEQPLIVDKNCALVLAHCAEIVRITFLGNLYFLAYSKLINIKVSFILKYYLYQQTFATGTLGKK
jgi:hypothetical protein